MPSSVIASIHYDSSTNTLRIEYVSGIIYDYINVPEEIYKELKSSFAKGIYLNKNIKGQYAYKKVSNT